MLKKNRVLFSSLTTPDGTELISHHRHDLVQHTDRKTGKYYMLDGGLDYVRSSNPGDGIYTNLTDEDPFEVIRLHFTRGSRGKDGSEPLRYIKLAEMSDSHLEATIEYCELRNATMYLDIYEEEKAYRKKHHITVMDSQMRNDILNRKVPDELVAKRISGLD